MGELATESRGSRFLLYKQESDILGPFAYAQQFFFWILTRGDGSEPWTPNIGSNHVAITDLQDLDAVTITILLVFISTIIGC